MSDAELHELIALAAVGALDEVERVDLETAITDRPDLREELAELEAVAATFAGATAETPPEHLRGDVLAAIADVPQLAAISSDADVVAPSVAGPPLAPVESLAGRRRSWTPVLAAAAAVVALLAGGLVARTLVDDDDTVDVAAVVDDDEAVTYTMEGAISTLRLVHSDAHGAFALVGEDVPMPPGDQVYELWLLTEEAPQRMEIFRPHDDGSVEMLMLDMEMPDGAGFAVTVEPAGGTDAPTGEIVAATA